MTCVDGDRLARSTPIDVMLREDFYVVINDLKYTATSPTGSGQYLYYTVFRKKHQFMFSIVTPAFLGQF